MEDINIKYNRLNSSAKKEAKDFIDFLLSKDKKKEGSSISAYKKKILQVSRWSDSDIALIKKNQKKLNRWKPKGW